MKRLSILIIVLSLFIVPTKVSAAGGFGVSSSGVTLHPGESTTITISSNNAVGRLDVSSSNSNVASVSKGSVFIKTPGSSENFTITANKVGSATVSVATTGNFATMDEEIITDTKNIYVNVVANSSSNTNNSNTNKNNTPNNNSNRGNTTIQSDPNKSSNNKLKEITIDGYKLTKIDDNNYSVIVRYDTESINISATAEDKKTKIEGTGNHKLNIGDNLIELILTAENGSQNKITILATRKDAFYIDDLDYVINNTKYDKEDITVKEDTKITTKDMEKIKKSNKTFSFNYYNQEKQLLYSWTINGKKIKKTTEFNTSVDNKSKYEKNIREISNYADGIIVHFKNDGDYPKGTRIKLFVGSKYSNNDKVNIYYFDPKTKTLKYVDKNYKVKNGYIEFDVVGDNYFISMSKISGLEDAPKNTSNPTIPILFFVFSILIFSLSVIIYFVRKKHLNKSKDIADNNNEEI